VLLPVSDAGVRVADRGTEGRSALRREDKRRQEQIEHMDGLMTTASKMQVLGCCLGLVLCGSGLATTARQGAQNGQAVQSRPAAPVQERLLVKFAAGVNAEDREAAAARIGGKRLIEYGLVPGLTVVSKGNHQLSLGQAMQALREQPGVEYVEPDYPVEMLATPNDPSYASQWGMANILAPTAWDLVSGAPGVTVAVLDSGIDFTHLDLAGNIWVNPGEIDGNGLDDDGDGFVDDVVGWDFVNNDNVPYDPLGHGTHVAGVIGATGNNALGVAGVCWDVQMLAVKVLDDTGAGPISATIAGLNYAVARGARVANASWGTTNFSQALYDAIASARDYGTLLVAAAGNGGSDVVGDNNDVLPYYPASYNLDNVIAVAAIDSTSKKTVFSNYGVNSVDLGAPGKAIYSTYPNNSYMNADGTSTATPHVAGTAALVWAAHPEWSQPADYLKVREQILVTARSISSLSNKTVTGATLDTGSAVTRALYPLTTPTGLAGTASSNSVALVWADTGTEWQYNVERSADGGSTWTGIASLKLNTQAYTDTGLQAATTYKYRVQGANSWGMSAYSTVLTVTTTGGTPKMHVQTLTVTLTTASGKTTGKAAIQINNASDVGLASATVSGTWTITKPGVAPSTTTASGVTGTTGTVTLSSPSVSSCPTGTVFTFTVTGVTKTGYVYDPSASHITTASKTK
jgi:subtilisin family serine protease